MQFATDVDEESIKQAVINDEKSRKYIEGNAVVKVIVVLKRIVNVVLKPQK